jgi:tetratricopeptide (TPR) repeat protein
MSTFRVLTIGVSLAFCLYATDSPAEIQTDPLILKQEAARDAIDQHDYNEAARLFSECMSLAANDAERFAAQGSYGIALHEANRNTEAKAALERALAGQENFPHGQNRVIISDALAAVDRSLGDYRGAERVLRTAMDYQSGTPEQRARLMLNLTDLLREEARETEAFAVLSEANQIQGLSSRIEVALQLETGEITREMGRWDDSFAVWNKLGEVAAREHSVHLEAVFTGGLGETWFDAGNVARAEPLLRRSLQLMRNDPTASAAQVGGALAVLARLYVVENKLALAEEALDEAMAKEEESFEPGHPQVALLLELRAQVLSSRGETQAALEDLERARAMMTDHFGAESMAVAGVLAVWGDVEARGGHADAAVTQYQRALELTHAAGRDGLILGHNLAPRYSAALKAAHKPGEARAVLAGATARSFREK